MKPSWLPGFGSGTVGTLRSLRLLVVALFLSGCTNTVTIPLTPTLEHLPSVSKIPLSVGIYYSPELRAYKHNNARPLGEASVSLFERLFPIMFSNAVTLETRQFPVPGTAELSIIIEPDIEKVQVRVLHGWLDLTDKPEVARSLWRIGQATFLMDLAYHFSLYSPSGEALGYWNVTGSGESKCCRGDAVGDPFLAAMEDAAKKIAIQFREIPAIKRLLQEKG